MFSEKPFHWEDLDLFPGLDIDELLDVSWDGEAVHKSTGPRKRTAQEMSTASSSTGPPRRQTHITNTSTTKCTTKKRKFMALCPFPSFHKCNALLYFPSAMARHLNCGDLPSLSELFATHFHKNCAVEVFCGTEYRLSVTKLLDFLFNVHAPRQFNVHALHKSGGQRNPGELIL